VVSSIFVSETTGHIFDSRSYDSRYISFAFDDRKGWYSDRSIRAWLEIFSGKKTDKARKTMVRTI
jgi:hypothetical protein